MSKLQHYQNYKFRYEIAFLIVYFFINATLLATSVIMEGHRNYDELPFQMWEPFIWEYASAISTLILFPCIVWLLKKSPFEWQTVPSSLTKYFFASIVFSVTHVAIMVGIKEVVYWFMNTRYDFGDFWFEMFYEYRKDVWSFLIFIFAIKSYGFILSRLQGEASPIAEGEESSLPVNIDRLLIKKLGKEFIIKVEDVQWLESAGNYVNLHIDDRIYPLRFTLGKLSEELAAKGFCRIHRSHAVRLDAIESITPLSSGDSEVKLITGKILNLSRRYKESFKSQLS
ncbi:MAG: LytTR family DNA-binding domain-containing protein [Thalassotalea sp.]|nr:LytTR family DNA-binding domain-containing protein [Thalassotalea sp.]